MYAERIYPPHTILDISHDMYICTFFSFLRASDVYMMLIAECGRHKEAETVRNMHYQGK